MRTNNPGIPVDLLADSGGTGADDAEVVFGHGKSRQDTMDEILQMLKRRPCTAADIDTIFPSGGPEKVEQYLAPLVRSGQVRTRVHGDRVYYVLQAHPDGSGNT